MVITIASNYEPSIQISVFMGMTICRMTFRYVSSHHTMSAEGGFCEYRFLFDVAHHRNSTQLKLQEQQGLLSKLRPTPFLLDHMIDSGRLCLTCKSSRGESVSSAVALSISSFIKLNVL